MFFSWLHLCLSFKSKCFFLPFFNACVWPILARLLLTLHYTVFLQKGSCIYSEKSYGTSNILLHQVNFSQQKISFRDKGLLQLLLWLGCLNIKFKLPKALNFYFQATRLVNQVPPVSQICVSRTLTTELLAQKECFKRCIIESTWCSRMLFGCKIIQ